MKKYRKPRTVVGIDALHELTISLYTWIRFMDSMTFEDEKPQIEILAKQIRTYSFELWCNH